MTERVSRSDARLLEFLDRAAARTVDHYELTKLREVKARLDELARAAHDGDQLRREVKTLRTRLHIQDEAMRQLRQEVKTLRARISVLGGEVKTLRTRISVQADTMARLIEQNDKKFQTLRQERDEAQRELRMEEAESRLLAQTNDEIARRERERVEFLTRRVEQLVAENEWLRAGYAVATRQRDSA